MVLVELAEEDALDIAVLGEATESSTVSALCRVGWMLDRFSEVDVSELREMARASTPTLLDPHGGRRVVECWISHGPRADDSAFDPAPGDWLTVGDDDEAPLRARVVRREGDRVSVQIQLSDRSAVVA